MDALLITRWVINEWSFYGMQDGHSNKRDSKKTTANILHRLSSVDAGTAWVEFLQLYSPLIMHSASQFVYEQDRINDCFLYVCEQLNDNGFRRLLTFDTAGRAKFPTWLGSVVFNLCVDWHRREYGRATLAPAISALPAFDQSVYRLVIEQGLDKESTFQILRADFPDLTRELIANAAARVFSLLTPRQRWQIGVRNRGRRQGSGEADQGLIERLPDPGFGPATEAQREQELESLQQAFAHLPAHQRLLLYLRFEQGLSLKKIAQVQQLGDSNRVWRHIQSAIDALYQHMRSINSAEKRKN
jgi:RNA polymerase sigma factor (sigma-70 family)